MRPIGFSTGALAKGDFRRGLELQRRSGISAIELSALRDHEMPHLLAALPELDLPDVAYVSFHAPSKLVDITETDVVQMLERLPRHWPIVVHPDIVRTPSLWQRLGSRVCLENMDNRKTTGRTVDELRALFTRLPEAAFCLDVGHARQVDPTMATALLMLRELGSRLVQLHVSDVGPRGEHLPVGVMAQLAFGRIAQHVPPACPLIIESIVPPEKVDDELAAVAFAFGDRIANDQQRFNEWRSHWEHRPA
jgi:hypothetical protein